MTQSTQFVPFSPATPITADWLNAINNNVFNLTISAAQFGAVGDCVINGSNAYVSGTDNTAAINSMLAFAALVSTQKGALCYLPPGRYAVSSNLNVTGTRITFTGPGEIYYLKPPANYNHCIIVSGNNCKVDGITIRCDPAAQRNSGYGFGTLINGGVNNKILNCSYFDIPSAAVWALNALDTQIHNNYVSNPKADGIHYSDGCIRGTCSNNTVIGSGDDSFAVVWDDGPTGTQPGGITFTGNIAYANVDGNGFNFASSSQIVAVGNYSYFSASCGFTSYLWQTNTAFTSRCRITGNYIYSPGQNPRNQAGSAGIYVGALADSDISGNTIDGVSVGQAWSSATTYAVGQIVSVSGASYICLSPSTNQPPASNPGAWKVTYQAAIYLDSYQHVTIASNTFKNVAGNGVWLNDNTGNGAANLTDLTVRDNHFYNITRRALSFNLTASATNGLNLVGNTFDTCGYVTADYNIIIGNSVATGNPVRVFGNTHLDNALFGISINQSTVTNIKAGDNFPEFDMGYAVTLTPGSGAFTTAVANGRYWRVGGLVHYNVQVNITTVGTASGALQFNLPVTTDANGAGFGGGRVAGGVSANVAVSPSSLVANVLKYDGSSPIAAGFFTFNGWFKPGA